ncbi:Zn-ribbon domain-containing OB-fold protein [Actinomadura rugatobispora]|uniref:Zn-ribbon domain-containing OB-fold protein n=1 Tax=Actinomadura rugatobispora TaxID=1994 RepID=A0ABW1A8R7_9ACTN
MTPTRPVAQPTPDTREFFALIDEGRLALPTCAACDHTFLYPRSVCPRCAAGEIVLKPATGRGTVASFVVNHRAAPGFGPGPYALALVRLEEGPLIMAGVPGDPDRVALDAPVRAVYEERGDRRVLLFEIVEETG